MIYRLVSYAHAPMRNALRIPRLLSAINAAYIASPWRAKLAFKKYFDRMFWKHQQSKVNGKWTVFFMGKPLIVPLRPATINLDWIYATSLIAHDPEVVATYEAILRSSEPPEIFLDIGANFGMHSLLMAKMGLKVFAFEPNPYCYGYGRIIHELNCVWPSTMPIALGNSEGSLELMFSKSETWLGSVMPDVVKSFEKKKLNDILRISVPVRRLDDIPLDSGRMLIKMDVEGAELLVLNGAIETLTNRKPSVIFESISEHSNKQLQEFFSRLGWKLYKLPFDPQCPGEQVHDLERTTGRETNFIAIA